MKSKWRSFAFGPAAPGFLMALFFSTPVWAAGGKGLAPIAAPPFVERPGKLEFSGQLIVRPLQHAPPAQDRQARQKLAGLVLKYYPEVDEYVIRAPAGRAGAENVRGAGENQLAADLLATGLYQYAVPNWICYPLDTVPNDPLFGSQWHHVNMQARQAWDITTGSPDIICAFTDTGIDLTHPDLAPHRVPGFNAVTDLAEIDGGDVSEIHGHGTHVSGCAAAVGNNSEGVAGVGWNMKIMMIRVALDSSGAAEYDDLLQGARWAIENGAKVVSASYSGIDYDPVQTTGEYIKSIGGLYCYAAGNDSRNLSWFDFPDVIICGASEYSDNLTWFTAYGLAVDVFAPGQDILSSCWGGGYCGASGTSMATPVTNGVIGLIWSVHPSLSPQQVETLLFRNCDDLGAAGNDDTYGWGRVNSFKAVRAAARLGDLNCDGALDFFDIDPFVLALTDLAQYQLAYPTCDPNRADVNLDDVLDFFDIDAFVTLVVGG